MGLFSEIDKFRGRTAVITETNQYSYEKLISDAQLLAAQVGGRKIVFLVCTNTYEALCGYLGFLRNDIVPLMISNTMEQSLFQKLLQIYSPECIYAPVKYLTDREPIFTFGKYSLWLDSDKNITLHKDLALLLTTSGSTGSPKYVKQSYENIRANTASIISYLQMHPEDRAITTLPMSYTYGLSIINTHLTVGASIVLTEYTLMQREFWKLLERTKANNFGGVPYTYQMLKKLHFEQKELPSLRYITQAGGRLGEELHTFFCRACEEKGISLIVMYGQTEATARMSWLPWDKSKDKIGSIGIAIPGGNFQLIDTDDSIIEGADQIGELVYRGANVTMGYATKKEDLAAGDERNGILFTGDMAYRDVDGFYYIAGRKKRFLKVYGNRVNLDELDHFLAEAGIEAVTAGEDDHVRIYYTHGENADPVGRLSKMTGLSRAAFKAIEIPAIPRSESGKILYTELSQYDGL